MREDVRPGSRARRRRARRRGGRGARRRDADRAGAAHVGAARGRSVGHAALPRSGQDQQRGRRHRPRSARAARHRGAGPATCSSASSRASCSSRSTAPRARCARSKRSSASTARRTSSRRPTSRSRRCARRSPTATMRAPAFERAQQLNGRGLLTRADRDTAETRLKVTEANYQAALDTVHSLKASLQDRRAVVRAGAEEAGRRGDQGAGRRLDLRAAGPARRVHPREHAGRDDRADEPAQAEDARSRKSTPSLIRPGQAVEFDVEAFLNRKFKGKIAYVSPAVDQATRTFAVEALVDNADRQLKPGFFAKGVVADAASTNRCWRCPRTRSRRWPASRRSTSSRTARRASSRSTLGARQNKLVEVTERAERRRDAGDDAT